MRSFLLYAIARLGLWVLLWWLLTLFGLGVVLAGVLAALISMLLSILFLDRLRDAAAMRWKAADERRAERRGPEVDEDAEYEDAVLDEAEADGDAVTSDAVTSEAGGESTASPAQLPDLPEADGTETGAETEIETEAGVDEAKVRGEDR